MFSRNRIRNALLGAIIALGCAAPALAARPHQQGQATFITGGIGDDETKSIRASASDYNLHITNSEKDGSFVAGIVFVIQGHGGGQVLRVRNAGPLLYAQLPPGSYVVRARYKGTQQVKTVSVPGNGAADLHLIWPQMD